MSAEPTTPWEMTSRQFILKVREQIKEIIFHFMVMGIPVMVWSESVRSCNRGFDIRWRNSKYFNINTYLNMLFDISICKLDFNIYLLNIFTQFFTWYHTNNWISLSKRYREISCLKYALCEPPICLWIRYREHEHSLVCMMPHEKTTWLFIS